MYIYIHVYTYISIFIYICVYVFMYIIYTYIYMYLYICEDIYTCIYIYIYIHVNTRVHVTCVWVAYMNISVFTYTLMQYIHIYTQMNIHTKIRGLMFCCEWAWEHCGTAAHCPVTQYTYSHKHMYEHTHMHTYICKVCNFGGKNAYEDCRLVVHLRARVYMLWCICTRI